LALPFLQKERYLTLLLQDMIRSTFRMLVPDGTSSDATNLLDKSVKSVGAQDQVEYALSGTKWWSAGSMDPRCQIELVVARLENKTTGAADTTATTTTYRHGAHMYIPLPQFPSRIME
jgi:alkylation response protein AidB-like acyl-CoA dehydrogenase